MPKWVDAVKSRYNNAKTKFACVGYCFGAPYVCNELAKDIVTVGAFAHPAFLKEHHFKNIKRTWYPRSFMTWNPRLTLAHHTGPLFLSCSELDHTFDVPSRRRALDILQADKKTYHYQLFAGVEHGFALRGDPDDPYQREHTIPLKFRSGVLTRVSVGWVKEESLSQIVSWFNYWLSRS